MTAPAAEIDPTSPVMAEGMPSQKKSPLAIQAGQQIKTLRKAAGLNQAEAAALAEMKREQWGQVERGQFNTFTLLEKCCSALNVEPTILLKVVLKD